MKRFVLSAVVLGSLVACLAAVAVVAHVRSRDIGKLRQSRGMQVDCGQWCVYRCSWLLGAPVDMEDIMQLLPDDSAGDSMAQLRDALRQIGFQAVGYKDSLDSFLQGEFPCIVHLKDPDHFVLATGRMKTGMLVFDGTGVRRRLTEKSLRQRWTGHFLRVQRAAHSAPLPRFKNRGTDGVPCIQFEALHVDHGDVPIGKRIVSFVYRFSNQGSQPLVVGDVHTDCKCLEVEKPEQPIAPGALAQIVLKYNSLAANRRGVFEHKAVVESNDPTYPLLPLYASGNTDARVTYAPQVIDFGPIVPGRRTAAFCFVHYTGEDFESFRVTDCRCSLPNTELLVISSLAYEEEAAIWGPAALARDSSDRVRVVQLTYEPPPSIGQGSEVSGTLEFETNVEDVGTISVPVQAQIVFPVAAIPSVLDFGELRGRVGATASASLVLRAQDRRPVHLLTVESDGPGPAFQYAADEREGEVTLNVVCDEKVALKNHKSTLNIHVQLEGNEKAWVLPVAIYAWRRADTDQVLGRQ